MRFTPSPMNRTERTNSSDAADLCGRETMCSERSNRRAEGEPEARGRNDNEDERDCGRSGRKAELYRSRRRKAECGDDLEANSGGC